MRDLPEYPQHVLDAVDDRRSAAIERGIREYAAANGLSVEQAAAVLNGTFRRALLPPR